MPRSRVLTITILACALLAAILFGAAAVLGWVLARPIGVVSGIAAVTNIALISSPSDSRARRIALVIGASILVLAAASGAWGFVSNIAVWLCLMPIGGALLMVPEVLNLMTPAPKATGTTHTEDEDVDHLPEPVVQIDGEDAAPPTDHDEFFSRDQDLTQPTAGGAGVIAEEDVDPALSDDTDPSIAVGQESASETTGRHAVVSDDDTDPSIPVWRESPSESTGRHGIAVDSPDDVDAIDEVADDPAPRGRRAMAVDWDEDDEEVDNDPADLPIRGRRAR